MMKTQPDIDTSPPFNSVKEAVVLFGERVLAGELYANRLRQMHDENSPNLGTIAAELEETKQSLVRTREDSMLMANVLTSLQEDLDHTKRELQQLKETKSAEKEVKVVDEEEDECKFDLDSDPQFDHVKTETLFINEKVELQKEKYVTFADPPTVFHVDAVHVVPQSEHAAVLLLQRHPSLKKPKKKHFIPFIKRIFRKKGTSEVSSSA